MSEHDDTVTVSRADLELALDSLEYEVTRQQKKPESVTWPDFIVRLRAALSEEASEPEDLLMPLDSSNPEAERIITDYLVHAPEQGDWPWEDHCNGMAGGIVNALVLAGLVAAVRPSGETTP